MFERFTGQARAVVIAARLQAEALRHERIGTEHLLLGLLNDPSAPAARLLAGHGLTTERAGALIRTLRMPDGTLDELDAEALRTIGIDLDAVRTSVEATFGEGALSGGPAEYTGGWRPGGFARLRFGPRAKKVLELSLREAIRLRQKEIRDLHLLLGILREGEGLAALVLTRSGIDLTTLRQEIDRQLRAAG